MLVLKMVNRHLAKLTREYTATQKGDLRALAIAEELSQVGDEDTRACNHDEVHADC